MKTFVLLALMSFYPSILNAAERGFTCFASVGDSHYVALERYNQSANNTDRETTIKGIRFFVGMVQQSGYLPVTIWDKSFDERHPYLELLTFPPGLLSTVHPEVTFFVKSGDQAHLYCD